MAAMAILEYLWSANWPPTVGVCCLCLPPAYIDSSQTDTDQQTHRALQYFHAEIYREYPRPLLLSVAQEIF